MAQSYNSKFLITFVYIPVIEHWKRIQRRTDKLVGTLRGRQIYRQTIWNGIYFGGDFLELYGIDANHKTLMIW